MQHIEQLLGLPDPSEGGEENPMEMGI